MSGKEAVLAEMAQALYVEIRWAESNQKMAKAIAHFFCTKELMIHVCWGGERYDDEAERNSLVLFIDT